MPNLKGDSNDTQKFLVFHRKLIKSSIIKLIYYMNTELSV